MTTRWYQEKKKEHYYKEAKRVGYRARSSFKLQQIQQKFHVMKKGDVVVDLGAAPGGWSQIAWELVEPQGTVIGVDLSFIQPLCGVQFIQGDITDTKTVERITRLLQGKIVDVVISDMSPDISGNYSVDQARSIWLCEHAFAVAQLVLKPEGHFVCKVFEGEDLREFLILIRQHFSRVKQFSPPASRKSSSETYLIAKCYHK